MITTNKHILSNGLTLIVHEDKSSPMAICNTLYKVGSRNETPDKTGFAHLFEHLMFEGSANVKDFDTQMQRAGGDNNAYTNTDVTNYYDILPAQNIETALWLESDRMNSLDLSQSNLDNQISVVSEEFKENYLNQPYGDVWHLLLDLAYAKHPYKWPVIGKNLKQIEAIQLADVHQFFNTYYSPQNAIVVVAGNVKTDAIITLVEKWFGGIPNNAATKPTIEKEPMQNEARYLEVDKDVPVSCIYKAYKMCNRLNKDYYTTDIISDILSNGESSRLNQRLVKEQKLFTEIDAYIMGFLDDGLFMIDGKLNKGVSQEQAEKAIQVELEKICTEKANNRELAKVQQKIESADRFGYINLLNRATSLAHYEMLGNADMINHQLEHYQAVTDEMVLNTAQNIFKETNCSTLYYNARNN